MISTIYKPDEDRDSAKKTTVFRLYVPKNGTAFFLAASLACVAMARVTGAGVSGGHYCHPWMVKTRRRYGLLVRSGGGSERTSRP